MTDWEITQERQLKEHTLGISVFSDVNKTEVKLLGAFLNKYLAGKTCLDIGCGILLMPGYMVYADKVRFVGIDPFEGAERKFEFYKAKAEDLPFKDKAFDGVLFATSLDHIEKPQLAINEAFRILKDKGYMIIWGSFYKPDNPKYQQWLKTGSLSIFQHPKAFTLQSLALMTKNFRLIKRINLSEKGKILIFQK